MDGRFSFRTARAALLVAAMLAALATGAAAQDIREERVRPGDRDQTAPAEPGFVASPARPRPGSDPVRRLEEPKRAVVLIVNHGTRRPQNRHVCDRARDIPPVIRELSAAQGWHIHYLCSNAIDGGVRASYTFKRAREIMAVVAAYRAQGVPARRILSVGHSAGGWSSLIAARQDGEKFGGVIAFAPAFAGPRYEERLYPAWRQIEFPKQRAFISGAARLNALVFAYPNDAFNRPQELRFLTRIPGARLVPVTVCQGGHGTTYTACLTEAARDSVRAFVRRTAGLTR